MHAFAILTLAAATCLLIHLLAGVVTGICFGLPVAEVGFGVGPAWLRVGRVRMGILPIAAYVRFGTLPEEVLGVAAQLVLALSGSTALIVVSVALLGNAGFAAFVHGFWQWLVGATAPLSAAQAMLAAARHQALEGTLIATIGLTAAKLAALNLTPSPNTNAGQALAVIGRRIGLARHWPQVLTTFLASGYLGVFCLWIFALAVFVIQR